MTIEEMLAKKREYGWTYEMIAEKSGVPLPTVQKIFGGTTKYPRYETIVALEELFRFPDEVMEEPEPYGDGHSTVEDWENLPDNCRAELIDGQIYYLGQPTLTHQDIVGLIYVELVLYIRNHHGNCKPFMSPIGVRLYKDNKNMVEPDVLVVCDKSKFHENKWIDGAPDFVVEVFSKGSAEHDFNVKYREYKKAGVREYWMVDPYKRIVYVSDFTGDQIAMRIINFDEPVPVLIFGGDLKIDLSGIE